MGPCGQSVSMTSANPVCLNHVFGLDLPLFEWSRRRRPRRRHRPHRRRPEWQITWQIRRQRARLSSERIRNRLFSLTFFVGTTGIEPATPTVSKADGGVTRRGRALRTKGKTQTWRYPDDPAVSLRHGPNGTPSGTPGRSSLGSPTGGLARRHFVGEMAHNREARGSRSRRKPSGFGAAMTNRWTTKIPGEQCVISGHAGAQFGSP